MVRTRAHRQATCMHRPLASSGRRASDGAQVPASGRLADAGERRLRCCARRRLWSKSCFRRPALQLRRSWRGLRRSCFGSRGCAAPPTFSSSGRGHSVAAAAPALALPPGRVSQLWCHSALYERLGERLCVRPSEHRSAPRERALRGALLRAPGLHLGLRLRVLCPVEIALAPPHKFAVVVRLHHTACCPAHVLWGIVEAALPPAQAHGPVLLRPPDAPQTPPVRLGPDALGPRKVLGEHALHGVHHVVQQDGAQEHLVHGLVILRWV
mmetsp:Transcript_14363/g.43687  ORF Transcript_14363/g.43687 Transcript_14363/m.43687 type:complete len:268 (-) Transcript_14363:1323-2126(-)